MDCLSAWKKLLKLKRDYVDARVCSLHFTESNYNDSADLKRRRLKSTAIPSCNLPGSKGNKAVIRAKQLRLENRNTYKKKEIEQKKNQQELIDKELLAQNLLQKEVSDVNDRSEDENSSDMGEDDFETLMSVERELIVEEPKTKDFGIQVSSKMICAEVQVNTIGNSDYRYKSIIKTDADMSTVTGLESFQLLETIVKIVKVKHGDRFEKTVFKMFLADRIVMTYMKLKQNSSYALLSVIFQCYTPSHTRVIFQETLSILSQCLKCAIKWPSREVCARNLPKCFEGFEDVRVVLDCTEVKTEFPQKKYCQMISFSHYKHGQTAKVLIGVSPSGSITFLSKVYGGRASDSSIFAQSDLMNLLEPEDAVMVDRGFLIDEACQKTRWKLIRPPFLRDKKQLSHEETLYGNKIAKARVHVERANAKIKVFRILGTIIEFSLVPLLDDIFTVICATINLSAPILADDKFMDH